MCCTTKRIKPPRSPASSARIIAQCTYVYKRAFEWSTFDLGYPSAIATVWFVIVLAAVLTLTYTFRLREKLEY